jgi:hypothetical protein
MIDFGLEYNFQSGFGGMLMVDTYKTFSFGYAYITSFHTALNQFSKGSHEVVLRFRLGNEKREINPEEEFTLETVSETNKNKPDRKERKTGTQNKERKKRS